MTTNDLPAPVAALIDAGRPALKIRNTSLFAAQRTMEDGVRAAVTAKLRSDPNFHPDLLKYLSLTELNYGGGRGVGTLVLPGCVQIDVWTTNLPGGEWHVREGDGFRVATTDSPGPSIFISLATAAAAARQTFLAVQEGAKTPACWPGTFPAVMPEEEAAGWRHASPRPDWDAPIPPYTTRRGKAVRADLDDEPPAAATPAIRPPDGPAPGGVAVADSQADALANATDANGRVVADGSFLDQNPPPAGPCPDLCDPRRPD